jgi:hypothetical protein
MSDTASRFEPHPDDPAPRAGRNNPSLSPQPRRAPKRERSPQARTAFLADNRSGLLAVRDLRPHGRGDYRDPRFLAPPDLCRDELRGEDGPPIFQLGGEIEARGRLQLSDGLTGGPPNVAAILQPRPAA